VSAFAEVSRWEQGLSTVDEQVYAERGVGLDEFVVVVQGAHFPAPLAEVLPEVCRYVGGFGLTVTSVHVQAATTAYVWCRRTRGRGPADGDPPTLRRCRTTRRPPS
jgi:hypothetical protein